MLAFAASTVPQRVFGGLATVITFVVGSVLANCGLTFTTDKLVISLLSHNKIKEMVTEKSLETVLLTYTIIQMI